MAPFNSPCAMTIEPPQSEATTPSPVSAPPPKTGTRIAAGALTALYVGIIVAVAVLVRPPTTAALAGVALLPGAVAFLAGLPKVLSAQPRGLMALFHLVVYPLAGVLMLGLPGALVASMVAGKL